MTTESWARPPLDKPSLTPLLINWQAQFIDAAKRGGAADTDIASFWLRDVDCAMPEPHYAARLMRAVLTDKPTDAHWIAREWLQAAATCFAENEEAKSQESPIDVCRAIARAP